MKPNRRAKKAGGRSKQNRDVQGKKSITKTLEGIDDWDDTEEPEFEDIPDGRYQVRIESAQLNHSKSSGRFQCSVGFEILSGELKGRKIFDHYGLEDARSRSYFKMYLARLGIDWPSKNELEDTLENNFIGALASVNVRTSGEFQNVRIERALEDGDIIEDEESSEKPTDDDEGDDNDDDKIKKGDMVSFSYKGEKLEGTVQKITKGTSGPLAHIEVEEREKPVVVDLEECEKIDDGNEGKDEDEGGDEGEGEGEGEGCTATFDDDDLSKIQKKTIRELAEQADFDPGDYNTLVDLLLDIAESVRLTGEFDDPNKLILRVKKKL